MRFHLQIQLIFRDHCPIVEEPSPDRWGIWISSLVPIYDKTRGEYVAVLGMDIDARNWITGIYNANYSRINIFMFISLLILTFYITIDYVQDNTEKIKNSQKRYKALFNQARDAIFIADTDTGLILDLNENAERLLMRNKDEVIGKPQTILHPEDKDHSKIFKNDVTRGGTELLESEIITSTGMIVPVEITSRVVDIGNQRVMQGFFRDVSEEKKMEEEKKRLEEELQQAEKLEALGQLAGGIAHDINNQLSGVIGFADLLKTCTTNERILTFVDRIISSSENISRLIKELLTFA